MDTDIPRGPEDVPLRQYIKSFDLIVLVKDIKSDRYIREERINYSESEARKWLGRITFWACNNGYLIETMSVIDYDQYRNKDK